MKPSIKWVGGKSWLAPTIKAIYHYHSNRRLVELFCGAASVSLHVEPHQALLNDINPYLVNFHRQWRLGALTVDGALFGNDEATYYANREKFNELIASDAGRHTTQAAQLFYYLNRTGFRGLCRFNKSGQYNVPFGHYKRLDYRRLLQTPRKFCRRWQISCGDFQQVKIRPYDCQYSLADFLYADPPYDQSFAAYDPSGFTWEDQERLARFLAKHDGPTIASNFATERICNLYADHGFTLFQLQIKQKISVGDRNPVQELLAVRNVSPLAMEALIETLRKEPK